MSRLRLGIIGTGRIAEHHARVFASFPDVEVAAAANRSPDKLVSFADRYGIRHRFTSADEMLASGTCDAALVLVSADQTEPVAQLVLAAGVPALIEKPPALSVEGVERLRHVAEQRQTPHLVAFNRRFYSVIQQAVAIVASEGPLHGLVMEAPERADAIRALGHPAHVIHRWAFANASHCVDLIRFVAGEVEDATCLRSGEPHTLDQSLTALLRFQGGAIGQYVAHWRSPGPWRLQLFGAGYRIVLEPLERGFVQRRGKEDIRLTPSAEDGVFKPGFHGQARRFLELCRGAAPGWPSADLGDALKTLRLMDQIERGASPAARRRA